MGIVVFWTPYSENKLEDIFEYYRVTESRKISEEVAAKPFIEN